MNEQEIRAAVVEEAKTWLGTRYHHHANVKGGGVDCAMILVEVFSKAGVIEWFDPRPYPTDWMLHKNEEKYLSFVLPHAREITRPNVKPGDIALYRFGRTFSHSAIIIDWPMAIHAYIMEKAVVWTDLTKHPLNSRPVRYFNVIGAK